MSKKGGLFDGMEEGDATTGQGKDFSYLLDEESGESTSSRHDDNEALEQSQLTMLLGDTRPQAAKVSQSSAPVASRQPAPYSQGNLKFKWLLANLEAINDVLYPEISRRSARSGMGLFTIQYGGVKVEIGEYKSGLYDALFFKIRDWQTTIKHSQETLGTDSLSVESFNQTVDALLLNALVVAYCSNSGWLSNPSPPTQQECDSAIGLFAELLKSWHLGKTCSTLLQTVAEKLQLEREGGRPLEAIVAAAQRGVESLFPKAAASDATIVQSPSETLLVGKGSTQPVVPATAKSTQDLGRQVRKATYIPGNDL